MIQATQPDRNGRHVLSLRTLRSYLLLAIGIVAVGAVGFWLGRLGDQRSPTTTAGAEATTWTCSMHPQIKLPEPGQCPICFMDLIPLVDEPHTPGGASLTMSEDAVAMANIRTAKIERRAVENVVRMSGKISYDETRQQYITAWVPGRLDRLYVDFTGVTVREGDHMVHLYSPDLVIAQQELLQSLRPLASGESNREDRRWTENVKSAQEKLRLLGLLPEQIEEIKQRGTPSDHMTIYAPATGTVIEKHANEGMYVETGTRIYTIADLTHLWVHLDAYESDLSWLRYGQPVQFTTESYQGEVFTGYIAFIGPTLDEASRTVKLRVNVPNDDMRLKPGMFVRAQVRSRIALGGLVIDPSLAGKWISPMHPEIIKDGPGKCDICGMDLVPADELGFVSIDAQPPESLVIPVTAPLITGKRAMVYVREPGDTPQFSGRDVLLGPRAGDFYVVRDGLEEGEEVVVSGAFRIDADLQIQGRPSMMAPSAAPASPAGEHDHAQHAAQQNPLHVPPEFIAQLTPVYQEYFQLQASMTAQGHPGAPAAAERLRAAVAAVDDSQLEPDAAHTWHSAQGQFDSALENWPGAELAEQRARFHGISGTMLEVLGNFGHRLDAPVGQAFCPMAFDSAGGRWLQLGDEIANPFFGGKMLRCGEIQRTYTARPTSDEVPQ